MINETERTENQKIFEAYIAKHHITDTERISFLRRELI